MFYKDDQPLEDNAELTVTDYEVYLLMDDYTILSLEPHLRLKNSTDKDIQTIVFQTITEEPIDGENGYLSFCFLDCTTGNANRTKSGVIKANSFAPGYHVNFYVYEGKYNRIKVRYDVYSASDAGRTDKKTVTVTYVYDEKSITRVQTPYAVPVMHIFQEGNQVKFNYAFDLNVCQLAIYNFNGQKIAQHNLMPGNSTFTLPERLAKGVYLCVLRNGQQTILNRKFIVQ